MSDEQWVHPATVEWSNQLPEEDDLRFNGETGKDQIGGLPTQPVLVMEAIAPHYDNSEDEARNAVHGGVLMVSSTTPAERIMRNVLRPQSHLIELGAYPVDDYDITHRVSATDGKLRHNGIEIDAISKERYIADLCRRLGVTRALLHLHTADLIETAQRMSIGVDESLNVYQVLGRKSDLNRTFRTFQETHPGSTIGAFGLEFVGMDEMAKEIIRLSEHGMRACIKFDEIKPGEILNGGWGVHFLPDISEFAQIDELRAYIDRHLRQRGYEGGPLSGVVQMYAPENRILSISSGRDSTGNYRIYESHIQSQVTHNTNGGKIITSDGAIALRHNSHTQELLLRIWPQITEYYRDNGVTGDQNMNFIVLPHDALHIARKLYDNPHLSSVIPMDFNPRAISGTKAAMGRFIEETKRPVNFDNFCGRSITIDPFYAANPHVLHHIARQHGLHAGVNGNFSVTSLGKLKPENIRQRGSLTVKMFAQDMQDPSEVLTTLEHVLAENPPDCYRNALPHINPGEMPDDDRRYEAWIESELKKVLETDPPV